VIDVIDGEQGIMSEIYGVRTDMDWLWAPPHPNACFERKGNYTERKLAGGYVYSTSRQRHSRQPALVERIHVDCLGMSD
jgi:hypothetical protein